MVESSLKDENMNFGVLSQAIRDNQTCRTTADNDVVSRDDGVFEGRHNLRGE